MAEPLTDDLRPPSGTGTRPAPDSPFTDAEVIAAFDWKLTQVMAERDRYREALKRLDTHPLLTRRAGPLELAARRIVREALRNA